MQCQQCKYFKNFKHTYGCEKYKKVIIDINSHKECFESYDSNTFINFFDDILKGKNNGY